MISTLGNYSIEQILNWSAPIGPHDAAEIKGYIKGAEDQHEIDLQTIQLLRNTLRIMYGSIILIAIIIATYCIVKS